MGIADGDRENCSQKYNVMDDGLRVDGLISIEIG